MSSYAPSFRRFESRRSVKSINDSIDVWVVLRPCGTRRSGRQCAVTIEHDRAVRYPRLGRIRAVLALEAGQGGTRHAVLRVELQRLAVARRRAPLVTELEVRAAQSRMESGLPRRQLNRTLISADGRL